ncbi:MAG: 2Fe-2S iron-sulfur cluster-binding protein [Burkholderiaceae bacterium]
MAAMLVLTIGVTCLMLGAGLTVFGLIQLAAGRRAGGSHKPNGLRPSQPSRHAESALIRVNEEKGPIFIHFEDQPPMAAEPGVLLNTLWEHLTHAECQQGECGGCRLKLMDGEVRWIRDPQASVNRQTEILACSCEPLGSLRCARP